MTTDEARRAPADVRAGAGRFADTAELPSASQRLRAARESKGVDLNRAERDTKIRAHYLDALERGDYEALPGAAYTKGFLRNYAVYLGLDPDDILLDWRRERGEVREEAQPIATPQPLEVPRQGLTLSRSVVWAVLLTAGVAAFAVYLGIQLLRFARPPTLKVTAPSVAVTTLDESATSYVLRGTSIPGATISIATPGRDQPYRISAGTDGTWFAEVELRRGPNQFDISATDPATGKASDTPAQLFIRVPFLVLEAPTLRLDQPSDAARFENGAIPVQGVATNATRVVVSARYLGPVALPWAPASSATASASSPPQPADVTVPVADSGAFDAPFDLTTGLWDLTVTASSAEGKTAALTRHLTVAYRGVNLVVTIRGGTAWLKVWVDGVIEPSIGGAGQTIRGPKTLTFTAQQSIEVRTGSSGITFFTLNGTSLGSLGPSGTPETWLFAALDPPHKTKRS